MAPPAASSSTSHLDCGLGGVESGTIERVGSILAPTTTNLRILDRLGSLAKSQFFVYKMDIRRARFLELGEI